MLPNNSKRCFMTPSPTKKRIIGNLCPTVDRAGVTVTSPRTFRVPRLQCRSPPSALTQIFCCDVRRRSPGSRRSRVRTRSCQIIFGICLQDFCSGQPHCPFRLRISTTFEFGKTIEYDDLLNKLSQLYTSRIPSSWHRNLVSMIISISR